MAIKNLYIYLLCLVLGLSSCVAQSKNINKRTKKQLDKIENWISDKNYDKAFEGLEELTNENPELITAHLKKGNLAFELERWDLVISSYEEILAIKPDYRDFRIYYSLAQAYRYTGDYDQAAEQLETLLEKLDSESPRRNEVIRELEEIEFVKNAYKNPVPFNPIKLNSSINTEHLEYLPAFNADGSEIIFTRRIGSDEDIYTGTLINDSIVNISPITTINSPGNEGAQIISPDGNLLIFTACDRDPQLNQGCDLFISTRKNGEWTKGKRMGSKFNTRYWESQASISADGKSIYFASDRRGGQGKKDIWVVTVNSLGKFNDAKNLGAVVNSSGNESSPFVHPDGQSLYFRSDTHPGMGDYDLFLSRKDSVGNWGKPINLGYPINTEKSEGALFVELSGNYAYFSTDRDTDPPQLDIFRFKLPEELRPQPTSYLRAIVRDKESKEPLAAKLEITNLDLQSSSTHYSDVRTGKLLTALPAVGSYSVYIQSDGYLFYSKHINLDKTYNALEPFVLSVDLERIPEKAKENEESDPVILENIFFETGSYALLENSMFEINKLKLLLEKNPNTKIKITGHTDNVGSDVANQILSEKRAEAVAIKLKESGISEERILHEGKGELEAIAGNDTNEGRQKNRRTEFVLIYPK